MARRRAPREGGWLVASGGSGAGRLQRGWISAEWGASANNRRARFYTLTKTGRRQLTTETAQWRRLAAAIGRILSAEEA